MAVISSHSKGKEEERKIIRQTRIDRKDISLVDIMLDKPRSLFPIDPRLMKYATVTRRIGFVTGDARVMSMHQMGERFISRITYVIIDDEAMIIEITALPKYRRRKLRERIFAYFLKDMEQRGIRHIELEWNEKYDESKRFYYELGFTGGAIMLLKVDTRKWRDYLKGYINENEIESRKLNPD